MAELSDEDMKRRSTIVTDILDVLSFHHASFEEGTSAMISVLYTALEGSGTENVSDKVAETLEVYAMQIRTHDIGTKHVRIDRGRVN